MKYPFNNYQKSKSTHQKTTTIPTTNKQTKNNKQINL